MCAMVLGHHKTNIVSFGNTLFHFINNGTGASDAKVMILIF